ncbi:MAG: Trp family transcriptional regulator [Patescibacteria group bacterium]
MNKHDLLIETFMSMKTKEEMRNLLDGILTPKELYELPMRIEIVKKIKSGIPQQQIAEKLGVGIATVTRGSKELQKGNFKYI